MPFPTLYARNAVSSPSVHSKKAHDGMLLKSAGSEARLSGFKTIALSLLDGLLWENYLTNSESQLAHPLHRDGNISYLKSNCEAWER